MANVDKRAGFLGCDNLGSASYTGKGHVYYIPSGDTSVYAVGDAVVSAAGADANGIPQIAQGATSNGGAYRGVIMAVLPVFENNPALAGTSLTLETEVIPATKTRAYYVVVDDDPNSIFMIQDDGLAALTATAANKLANFTYAAPTGSQQVSQSVMSTTVGTAAANFSLRIMGLAQRPDNVIGAYGWWMVKFNNHELANGATGV